uniref:Uncharacterized protein n=1 Tax=Solanum tuberosum TaxID=4113 RepID=M1DMP8_SOLTU
MTYGWGPMPRRSTYASWVAFVCQGPLCKAAAPNNGPEGWGIAKPTVRRRGGRRLDLQSAISRPSAMVETSIGGEDFKLTRSNLQVFQGDFVDFFSKRYGGLHP